MDEQKSPDRLNKSKKPKGGARPGAGMPKGHVTKKTLDKLASREMVRQYVMQHIDKMLRAQVQNAIGIDHLFMRDDNGKFIQITDPITIEQVLNSGEEGKYFYIHTKDPSVQAFTDLMNRALDKPKEQEQEVKVTVDDVRKLTTEELTARALALVQRMGGRVADKAMEDV